MDLARVYQRFSIATTAFIFLGLVGTPAASPTAACSPALHCGTSNKSRASPEKNRARCDGPALDPSSLATATHARSHPLLCVDCAKRPHFADPQPGACGCCPYLPNRVELIPTLGALSPPEAGPSRTRSSRCRATREHLDGHSPGNGQSQGRDPPLTVLLCSKSLDNGHDCLVVFQISRQRTAV